MRCDQSRDLLSARMDGEATDDEVVVLERHLASCADCTTLAADLALLERVTRLSPAEPVPDLTAAVMAAHAPRHDPRREAARWSLVVVACAQLLLALPSLLVGTHGAGVHNTRELGSWSVALAVGLLVAAWQPARAKGMLPLGVVLAAVLALGAMVDILDGTVGGAGESGHLLELAGVALLWLVSKREDEAAARLTLAR